MTTTIEVTILEPNITIDNAPVENVVTIEVNELGTINTAGFLALMREYNNNLPQYANEEDAAADGLVSGDEFIWSSSTDVGIAGDKHIMS